MIKPVKPQTLNCEHRQNANQNQNHVSAREHTPAMDFGFLVEQRISHVWILAQRVGVLVL